MEGVDAVLGEFLDAFEMLDLDRFMACWAHDATAIHPFPEAPRRLNGWEEVRSGWQLVFDFMRATVEGPPYLDLRPLDLGVRPVGDAAAMVTFHLDLEGTLGRRTLVLENQAGAWTIVHLHASNVP